MTTVLRVPVTELAGKAEIPTMYGIVRDSVTRVVTDKYRGVWLPVPGNPVLVSGLPGNWRWSPDTGTMLAETNEPMAAQDYTTLSQVPEITAEELIDWTGGNQEGFFGAVDQVYSRMPDDSPDSLFTATSKAIAGSEDASPFEQAASIQEHLRSASFTYSEKTPVEDGYDGSGMQVIEAFLEEKAGYCVHFASTMAMMARTLGIPSRIVTGYAPGSATGISVPGSDGTTLNEFTVSSRNAHAWPELYFPGAGWVAFEPTPGRGVPPAYAPAARTQNPSREPIPRVEPDLEKTGSNLVQRQFQRTGSRGRRRNREANPFSVAVAHGHGDSPGCRDSAGCQGRAAQKAFARNRRFRHHCVGHRRSVGLG